MAETVERLLVEIRASIKNFKTNMTKVGAQLKDVRGRFGTLGKIAGNVGSRVAATAKRFRASIFSMKGAILGLVTGVVIKKIGGFVNSIAAMGDEIAKTSRKLGLAPEALSELRFAADVTGVAVQQLQLGIQRMTRRIAEAAQGAGEAQGALKELGLDARDLSELPVDEQFKLIADAMENVTSQSDKVRLGFKLFDSEGVNLINTMRGGSKELNRLAAEARRLGIVFTRQDVAASEQFTDALSRLKFSLIGLGRTVFADVIPAISTAFDSLKNIFVDSQESGESFAKSVGNFVKGLAFVSIGAVELMKTAWTSLQIIWVSTKASFLTLQVAIGLGMVEILRLFQTGVEKIAPLFDTVFTNAIRIFKTFSISLVTGIGTLFKSVLASIENIAGQAINLLSRISAVPGVEELTAGFNQLVFGSQAAQKGIENFARSATTGIAGINEEFAPAAAASGKLKTALDALHGTVNRDAAALREVQDELSSLAASEAVPVFDRIRDKVLALNATFDENKQKLNEVSAAVKENAISIEEQIAQTTERWLSFFGPTLEQSGFLAQSFMDLWAGFKQSAGDAIGSAIVFGESLQESFKAIFKNIAKTAISALAQIAIQFALQAAVGSAAAATIGAAQISTNLGTVFSGAFAATAGIPIIGPALAPAVASAALTAATAGTAAAKASGAALGASGLQAGGLVTGPTFAMVGEAGPELVIPLDRLGEFNRGGGGNQTIILEVDGEQLAQLVVPNMPDILRAQFGATF